MRKFNEFIDKPLFEEEQLPERTVVFCWGRFNPPTIGHQMVFQRAEKLAQSKQADFKIYTSQTHDKDKNPLTYDQKIYYLRRYFPKYASNIVKNDEVRTLFDVVESVISFGYGQGWLVVGEDRVVSFQKQINKYYSDRIKIQVVSAGERDNSGGIKTVSGSILRNYVKKKDWENFVKYSPRGVDEKILEDVFHEIRRTYGVSHQTKESLELARSPERERLHAGEYKKGDYVMVKDTIGQVESIGANYLNVHLLEDGKIRKVWPSDITKL